MGFAALHWTDSIKLSPSVLHFDRSVQEEVEPKYARDALTWRLVDHHAESVSGGRAPSHGRCALDTRPLDAGLRPARALETPRNIHSFRQEPAATESKVFSFETMPFNLRIVPAFRGGLDGGRHSIIAARKMPAADGP
jgi:hypothetical protein